MEPTWRLHGWGWWLIPRCAWISVLKRRQSATSWTHQRRLNPAALPPRCQIFIAQLHLAARRSYSGLIQRVVAQLYCTDAFFITSIERRSGPVTSSVQVRSGLPAAPDAPLSRDPQTTGHGNRSVRLSTDQALKLLCLAHPRLCTLTCRRNSVQDMRAGTVLPQAKT